MATTPIDVAALRAGQRRTLAKAITLVESKLESQREQARSILEEILPHSGNSVRIGISGSPGVGKSTFIEAFGLHLLEQGKRVAVLAVDPSSPLGGGSILGDKTRMEELSRSERAFIRPTPASGALGGVAQRTRETMLLCEAAGHDVVLVETVGVGQSEHEVAGMVDFFLVLMQPNAGDELQGIKKGIMELADALVINKADGESANQAELACEQYRAAMTLLQNTTQREPQVLTCSALERRDIDTIWRLICEQQQAAREEGTFQRRRDAQARDWMHQLLGEMLQRRLQQNPAARQRMVELEREVIAQRITPYAAACRVIECL